MRAHPHPFRPPGIQRGFLLLLPLLLLLGASPRAALAVTGEIEPETIIQVEQYRDVDRLRINKNRFTQYLSFGLFEDRRPVRHTLLCSMRLDADLGSDMSLDAPTNSLGRQRFALLYLTYEGRRLFDLVDLRLGRMIRPDELAYQSFDGASISLYRHFHFGVEFYAGMLVKGSLSEDAGSFNLPNTTAFDAWGVKPDEKRTATFGGAVFLDGFENTSLKIQYRHQRDDQDRGIFVGAVGRQRLFHRWDLFLSTDYRIDLERFQRLEFGTQLDFEFLQIEASHRGERPIFDADSIFNFFPGGPQARVGLDVHWKADRFTRLTLGYARARYGGGSILFDRWGVDGRDGTHEGSLRLERDFGSRGNAWLSYDFGVGQGGDLHRAMTGGQVDLFSRYLRLAGAFMGSWYRDLTLNDLLWTLHRNEGFSWGVWTQGTFRINQEVRFSLETSFVNNRFLKQQWSVFMLLDMRSWL